MTDPIEGFHFVAYDETSEILTIAVDRAILSNPTQEDPLVKRAIEIMAHGKGVSKVEFVDRRPSTIELYTPQTVKVHLYRDDECTSHVTIVEIHDLGATVDFGKTEPSSDSLLGMLAKKQLEEDGRFQKDELDTFTIYVER